MEEDLDDADDDSEEKELSWEPKNEENNENSAEKLARLPNIQRKVRKFNSQEQLLRAQQLGRLYNVSSKSGIVRVVLRKQGRALGGIDGVLDQKLLTRQCKTEKSAQLAAVDRVVGVLAGDLEKARVALRSFEGSHLHPENLWDSLFRHFRLKLSDQEILAVYDYFQEDQGAGAKEVDYARFLVSIFKLVDKETLQIQARTNENTQYRLNLVKKRKDKHSKKYKLLDGLSEKQEMPKSFTKEDMNAVLTKIAKASVGVHRTLHRTLFEELEVASGGHFAGQLDVNALGGLVTRALGVTLTKSELAALADYCDINKNKVLDANELAVAFSRLHEEGRKMQKLGPFLPEPTAVKSKNAHSPETVNASHQRDQKDVPDAFQLNDTAFLSATKMSKNEGILLTKEKINSNQDNETLGALKQKKVVHWNPFVETLGPKAVSFAASEFLDQESNAQTAMTSQEAKALDSQTAKESKSVLQMLPKRNQAPQVPITKVRVKYGRTSTLLRSKTPNKGSRPGPLRGFELHDTLCLNQLDQKAIILRYEIKWTSLREFLSHLKVEVNPLRRCLMDMSSAKFIINRDTFLQVVKQLYPQGTQHDTLNRIYSSFDPTRNDSARCDEIICAIYALQRFISSAHPSMEDTLQGMFRLCQNSHYPGEAGEVPFATLLRVLCSLTSSEEDMSTLSLMTRKAYLQCSNDSRLTIMPELLGNFTPEEFEKKGTGMCPITAELFENMIHTQLPTFGSLNNQFQHIFARCCLSKKSTSH